MKRAFILFVLALITMFMVGCETWSGVKKDTKSGWNKTKSAIHNATAPKENANTTETTELPPEE